MCLTTINLMQESSIRITVYVRLTARLCSIHLYGISLHGTDLKYRLQIAMMPL